MKFHHAILLALTMLSLSVKAAEPQVPQLPVALPPIPPSPIEEFRSWLQMPEADRERAMLEYPEEKRTVLRAKLQTYSTMPSEQRERQLTMLELRWHLRPLMGLAPESRGDYLRMIPARLHELVSSRLQRWDQLDAVTRAEILANDDAREMAMRYFVYLRRSQNSPDFQALDEAKRAELQEKLSRWSQTSASARQRMGEQLAAFFELPKSYQNQALGQFADSERQEMQKTLDSFATLSPEQRRACVESFQKFATMTPSDRAEFLRKAERWQQMSPQERATWKQLVSKLPPMPPSPSNMPPLPRAGLPRGENVASKATE